MKSRLVAYQIAYVMDVESRTCLAYAMNRTLPDLTEDVRNTALRFTYNAIVTES